MAPDGLSAGRRKRLMPAPIINAPLIDENLLNRRGADYTTKRYSVIRLLCRRWNYTMLANRRFSHAGHA